MKQAKKYIAMETVSRDSRLPIRNWNPIRKGMIRLCGLDSRLPIRNWNNAFEKAREDKTKILDYL